MEKVFVKQRDIVLLPFPFSDQSGQKARPALVVSSDEYNRFCDDIIVCAITSNTKLSRYTTILRSSDLESGVLFADSAIKCDSIGKIQQFLIIKTIGALSTKTFKHVREIVYGLLR